MKIFKALNCVVCEAPFAPIENQPRCPMVLDCGKAMCRECFYKERSARRADRKHQCEYGEKCFDIPYVAYFLIGLLSHDSLRLSPKDRGYLLCKPLKCPVCDDEFANTLKGKPPFCLWQCRHIICSNCFEKPHLEEEPNQNGKTYEVKCPICSVVTGFQKDELTKDGLGFLFDMISLLVNSTLALSDSELSDFFTELPEMTSQWEGIYRFCEECEREQPIEDMFHCEDCEKNICASCGFKKHRLHKTLVILETETTKIADQLQKLFNNYENLFPELHKEVLDEIATFGTKLLPKEEKLKQASTYQDLRKLNTKFEAISEKYITHSREYNAEVKDLIKSLDGE